MRSTEPAMDLIFSALRSMARTMLGSSKRSAVTLLELVIVLLILGVSALMAAPRFSGALNRYRLQTAAERIALDLQMARRAARNSGMDIAVIFDSATHSYSMPGVPHLDHSHQPYAVNLTQPPYTCWIHSVDFPGGLGGSSQVVFNRFDTADGGGTVVLHRSGQTKSVVLNATSAEATVQ
ncbi:MAG: hypothetical protein KF752_13005 [Pirellulaceae bacterium]|nr:hypothetical protein [Pirellulaceae bacterium]